MNRHRGINSRHGALPFTYQTQWVRDNDDSKTIPDIPKNQGPLGDMHTLINIIFHQSVWETWKGTAIQICSVIRNLLNTH